MAVDPKVIYLEADEEITSVVDKLRKTEFNKVILVVPKDASLLQSIVNLKLLKRQAENLNKSIAVVTGDKVGRNLAEKVGLMTSAKIDEDLKLAESFDLPEENSFENEEVKEIKESDDGPLAETKEVIYKKEPKNEKVGSVKTKNREDDDDSLVIKEGEDENSLASEQDTQEEKGWNKKQLEEPEAVSLMPKFPLKRAMLIGGIVLLVLLSVGFVFIPRARATVMMKSERKQVSLSFKGDKTATLDIDKAIIPVQLVEATKDSSKSFQATGSKNVGTKASGTLTVLNGSDSAVTLATFSPTGHSDLVFIAPVPITVDKGGSKTVLVEAAQPGDQYNGFTNGSFYAVKANDPSIIVKCYTGTSGGTTKQVKYVTQGDVDAAKDNLSKDALDEARTDFNKKVADLKVVDDSKKEDITSVSANPDVNSEATTFTLSLKVSVKSLAFSLSDVSSLVKAEVVRQLGFSKQVIDDGSKDAKITVDSFDVNAGTISGNLIATAYASTKLDEDQIRTQLIGMNEKQANDYLTGLEGVETTKIEFWPTFIKLFPRIKNHIFLNVQVSDLSKDN